MTQRTSNPNLMKFFICPHCKALCEEGHDDEFQITCGNCGKSFRSDHEKCVCIEESYLKQNFKRVTRMTPGWNAYIPIEE